MSPVYPKPEEFLVFEGSFFTAEWYYTFQGRLPAYEYYRELNDLDRANFVALVKHFCNRRPGIILPKTIYRVEDRENKIYAFKSRSERFFNFTTEGAKVIVTNAYHKHSQKMALHDLEQLRIASLCRVDYLRRVGEKTYYAS